MLADFLALSPGFELVRLRSLSRSKGDVTREAFDHLLSWLHPDREEAI